MVTFTPNGRYVLVANEGEPSGYCLPGDSNDPEGSVSVIDISRGVANLTQSDVRTADFPRLREIRSTRTSGFMAPTQLSRRT